KKTRDRVELKLARLLKEVVDVHVTAFDRSAEAQIMLPAYPTDVIACSKVVPDEAGIGIVAESKSPGNVHQLDRLPRRLERNIDAKIADVGNAIGGTTPGCFARVIHMNVVEKGWREDVALVN